MSNDNKMNVTSYHQSGGITAGVVNFAPAPRTLDADLRSALLSQVPINAKIDLVAVNGDPEAFALASQVKDFLISHNRHVGGIAQAMFNVPPMGQILERHGDVYKIIIGHRQQ